MPNSEKPGVQGEGDYISAKRFDDEERSFVKSGRVDEKAREAADALDGPEGEALEEARKVSAEGKSLPHGDAQPDKAATDRHTENNLDHGLEETFPASDPVSISPGAD
jgi:hypothetical protein